MALSIHGTTYNTVMQMTSRIAELTYKNRLLGESDDRATELNAIFESLEATTDFDSDEHRQYATGIVLSNMVYLSARDAPVLTIEEEFDIVKSNVARHFRTNKIEGNIIMNMTSSYHLAKVFFDDGEPIPAVVPDLRWNGWAMPLIPIQNARENLLKANFYETFEITDDGIHYIDGNENPAHAPLVMLAGEKFYNFGELGLCWNQEEL